MSIPERETTITVNTFCTGAVLPLEGVKVYLFTEAGSCQNQYQQTNAQGQVTFSVPDQGYKVRVDYLGGQYWSDPFQWQDREVVIDEGLVDLHVTWNGAEVSGAPVYLFTETGTYLSRSVSTDPQGHARFQVPVKPYKFRIDYSGQQYWTGVMSPIAHQSLAVEVPLEQLALMPTNNPNPKRYDGEAPVFKSGPIKVASLGSLVGILSQTVVAQVAQPKVYYYISDLLGTPQKVLDAAGAVVWSGDYWPFGEVSSGVSTVQNAFRFPGQYFDTETGLHYNYHRYYQPRVARYLTPDLMGLSGGMNLYIYVENSPSNAVDPMGLFSCNSDGSVNPNGVPRTTAEGAGAWAQHQYLSGSKDYTFASAARGTKDTYKCNVFVRDALQIGGGLNRAEVPKHYVNGVKQWTFATANDLADLSKNTDVLGPGDGALGNIVSWPSTTGSGHTGIVGCDGKIYSAGKDELYRWNNTTWLSFAQITRYVSTLRPKVYRSLLR